MFKAPKNDDDDNVKGFFVQARDYARNNYASERK